MITLSKLLLPIYRYPNQGYIFSLKSDFNTLINSAHLKIRIHSLIRIIKFLLVTTLTILFFPLSLILYFTPFRIVRVNFSQIGAYIYLDAFLREYKFLASFKHHYIVSYCPSSSANEYLLSLYNPHVFLTKNILLKFFLLPFNNNPLVSLEVVKYDSGHIPCQIRKIWSEYDLIFKPLLKMPSSDIENSFSILHQIGLPKYSKFVALHVRESGFYNDFNKTTRNADIFSYESAISFLIDTGYYVIRIGDEKMSDISSLMSKFNGKLIDYAHSHIKCGKLDTFLLSNCDFYLGTNSGVAFVPPMFGTDLCLTNYYPASGSLGFGKNDLTLFKKITDASTGMIVNEKLQFAPPLEAPINTGELLKLGYIITNNTAEDILLTVKEFLNNRKNKTISVKQISYKNLIKKEHWSYGSASNFSTACFRENENTSK